MGAQPPQLFEMEGGQLREQTGTEAGQGDAHDAPVVGVGLPRDQPRGLGPVDESDRAVVAELEVLGDVTDGGT